jgi:hypothetical protein
MSEKKFKEYYTYLSDTSKKEFASLHASLNKYTGDSKGKPTYMCLLTSKDVLEWNHDGNLGLKIYQMDDLLHISQEIVDEWGTL